VASLIITIKTTINKISQFIVNKTFKPTIPTFSGSVLKSV
jgi:hypothetical protein